MNKKKLIVKPYKKICSHDMKFRFNSSVHNICFYECIKCGDLAARPGHVDQEDPEGIKKQTIVVTG